MSTLQELERPSQAILATDLFVGTEQQLYVAKKWNHDYSLGFKDSDFPAAGVIHPVGGRISAVVLDLSGPTLEATMRMIWMIMKCQHLDIEKVRDFSFDERRLRLYPGRSHQPGIRWRMIKFDSYLNEIPGRHTVAEVRNQNLNRPGIFPAHELLWAALFFPEWLARMGDDVPKVHMAGFQVSSPGEKDWAFVPSFDHQISESRKTEICIYRDTNSLGGRSIPTFLDLQE